MSFLLYLHQILFIGSQQVVKDIGPDPDTLNMMMTMFQNRKTMKILMMKLMITCKILIYLYY